MYTCVLPCMLIVTVPTALNSLLAHDFYTTSLNRVTISWPVFVLV